MSWYNPTRLDGFGRSIDLATSEYDPTYGSSQGVVTVYVCDKCGALVEDSMLVKHFGIHDGGDVF